MRFMCQFHTTKSFGSGSKSKSIGIQRQTLILRVHFPAEFQMGIPVEYVIKYSRIEIRSTATCQDNIESSRILKLFRVHTLRHSYSYDHVLRPWR
jgi:hypothetical protein